MQKPEHYTAFGDILEYIVKLESCIRATDDNVVRILLDLFLEA